MPSTPSSPIVLFYDPQVHAPDLQGRTLNTVLSWPDTRLESCHNYIQFLFPIPEPSAFNNFAPAVDEDTYNAFRLRPELRASLKRSYLRILAFYGFQHNENSEEVYVSRTSRFSQAATRWVRRVDHNHLRITRILRSLRVLGLVAEAAALWRALTEVYEEKKVISERSYTFWTRAAKRPLRLAPEDEGDENQCGGLLHHRRYVRKHWLPGYENHDNVNDNKVVEKLEEHVEKEYMDGVKEEENNRKRPRDEDAAEIDKDVADMTRQRLG